MESRELGLDTGHGPLRWQISTLRHSARLSQGLCPAWEEGRGRPWWSEFRGQSGLWDPREPGLQVEGAAFPEVLVAPAQHRGRPALSSPVRGQAPASGARGDTEVPSAACSPSPALPAAHCGSPPVPLPPPWPEAAGGHSPPGHPRPSLCHSGGVCGNRSSRGLGHVLHLVGHAPLSFLVFLTEDPELPGAPPLSFNPGRGSRPQPAPCPGL